MKYKVSKAVWFESNQVAVVFYSVSICQGQGDYLWHVRMAKTHISLYRNLAMGNEINRTTV